MIITKKDSEGRVVAYADFRLMSETGTEVAQGNYAWIEEVWIHEPLRSRNVFNSILEDFIYTYSKKYPSAKFIYWKRKKHKDRMSLYVVDKIKRRIYGRQEKGRHEHSAAASANTNTVAV